MLMLCSVTAGLAGATEGAFINMKVLEERRQKKEDRRFIFDFIIIVKLYFMCVCCFHIFLGVHVLGRYTF